MFLQSLKQRISKVFCFTECFSCCWQWGFANWNCFLEKHLQFWHIYDCFYRPFPSNWVGINNFCRCIKWHWHCGTIGWWVMAVISLFWFCPRLETFKGIETLWRMVCLRTGPWGRWWWRRVGVGHHVRRRRGGRVAVKTWHLHGQEILGSSLPLLLPLLCCLSPEILSSIKLRK